MQMDSGEKLLGFDRLDHIVVGAGAERANLLVPRGRDRNHDDLRSLQSRKGFQAPARFIAVDSRHLDVQENDIRLKPRRLFESLFAAYRQGDPLELAEEPLK